MQHHTVAPPTLSVHTTPVPTTPVSALPSLPSRPYLLSPNPFSLLTPKPEEQEQHEPKTPKKTEETVQNRKFQV